ncbi:MAG: hypothetical protein ACK5LE_05995 [Alphaproteobacteria bacterium]
MTQKGTGFQLSKIAALLIVIITFLWGAGLTFLWLQMPNQYSPIIQTLPKKIKNSNQMLNATEFAFINRFGIPQYRQVLGQTHLIQYRNLDCVMAIYLSPMAESNNSTKVSKKISFFNRKDLTINNSCLNEFTTENSQ